MLLYSLSAAALLTLLSLPSPTTADCITDKTDCKCLIPANLRVVTYPILDCKGTGITNPNLSYSLGSDGNSLKSYQLSRPLRPEEQFDLSGNGIQHGAVGEYRWKCADYIGSAPKLAGTGCYNVPNGQQADCYRIVNWNMCVDEREHA